MMKKYEMLNRGQITRYEAGTFYRAYKEGNIEAKPEFSKMMYDEVDLSIRYAGERYNRDYAFYDRVENLTKALLVGDFEEAQQLIDKIQDNMIELSGQKSIWHKYKGEN